MRRVSMALSSGVVALALSISALPTRAGTTLGASPALGGGEYSSGGGLTVAVELRRTKQGVALCGAWAQSRRLPVYLRTIGRDVMAHGSVAQNGRVIAQGLDFLTQVGPDADYAGADASCALVPGATLGGGPLRVIFPSREVVNFRNGRKGGGMVVRFGPSLDTNPAMNAGSLLPEGFTRITGTPEPQPKRRFSSKN